MPTIPSNENVSSNFRFTKASLTSALAAFVEHGDPAKDQLDCYDTEAIGLVAVLYRKSKRINFRSRYTFGHRRLSEPLGDLSPAFSVEQARLACAKVRLQAVQGTDPRAGKQAGMTFAELVTEHYFPITRNRKRSHKDDVQKYERWLCSRFGGKPIAAVTSAEIVTFLDMLQATEKLAAATVNRYLALLKAIFRFALEEGVISRNPTKNVRPLVERNERKRFLNAQERQAFVSACNEDENRHAAALFMLLLYTGARLGEALDAKLQDVDLNSATWFLPMTKAGKSAHVHLSDAAVSMLRGVIGTRKSGFLFPGKDPAKAMTRPAKALARISARAGLVDFHIHDLRRTWASVAVNAGVPLFTVSKVLRHASPAITAARYAHLQDKTLVEANNLVAQLI